MLDDDDVKTRGYGTPGAYSMLSVSDTGEGIDEETQKRVFDRFFTTKELGRGTGLGLAAIVYGIVKQNNGYINVYSEVGRGTTFKIYLPFVSRASADWQPEDQQVLRGGTQTILVAEDNEAVRRLTSSVLQQSSFSRNRLRPRGCCGRSGKCSINSRCAAGAGLDQAFQERVGVSFAEFERTSPAGLEQREAGGRDGAAWKRRGPPIGRAAGRASP